MECQRIVSHKNCSGFKNIGIPIQLFKNTKEETISYCQKMQCRIAEDQLQETNSNANYILPRGERKHLSHACSMVMSGVESRTVKQKSWCTTSSDTTVSHVTLMPALTVLQKRVRKLKILQRRIFFMRLKWEFDLDFQSISGELLERQRSRNCSRRNSTLVVRLCNQDL